jgi:inner membrane protein
MFFAHIGITLAAAYVIAWIVNHISPGGPYNTATRRGPMLRGRVLDWRLLVLGALLPDIIDKPIGIIFFGSEGRLVAHTFLFTVVLVVIGLLLTVWGRPWLLIVAICCAGHLALDLMWRQTGLFYWPFYGWHMVPYDPLDWNAFRDWTHLLWEKMEDNRLVLVSEIIGGAVVAVLLLLWARSKRQKQDSGKRSGER